MLKKAQKPESNSFSCIEMMIKGAKKRRMLALSAVRALDTTPSAKTNVLVFK